MISSNHHEILVIDDHELVRASLIGILSDIFRSPIIHEATDSSEALLEASRHNDINVVLLDLLIPGINGVSLLPKLKQILPNASFIIITAKNIDEDIQTLTDCGVTDIISKSTDLGIIRDNLVMHLLGDASGFNKIFIKNEDVESRDLKAALSSLTKRQQQILELLALGKSNKEISTDIFLAEGTVKNHISAIFNILDVNNRTGAVFIAKKYRLI